MTKIKTWQERWGANRLTVSRKSAMMAEIAELRAALSASDIQPMAAPDPTPGSKFMVMMDSALRHAESFGNANIATSLVREMILAYQAAALSPAPQPSQAAKDMAEVIRNLSYGRNAPNVHMPFYWYSIGHRDARYAAAELVAAHEADARQPKPE